MTNSAIILLVLLIIIVIPFGALYVVVIFNNQPLNSIVFNQITFNVSLIIEPIKLILIIYDQSIFILNLPLITTVAYPSAPATPLSIISTHVSILQLLIIIDVPSKNLFLLSVRLHHFYLIYVE